ncbi:tRNA (adenosine(37)-N6)-dimethylallyltransferase MiaA [uncultured Maribacter sp.]|uniref:tRNA (adenosine(37)-N6)-dimethylallyltransferase MiaA n=1 Tax=uncultured Maribacter sp. TaxID=431308 RepID=UPI0030EEDF02|tara:strand:- start:59064 stop:59984 length:921 start_codon:yes stop_codon:yes gene_type:complete
MNKILISVVGPTAIGKTKLAILLAEYYNTEIISADSRQFFKEMNIGTAVPSNHELNLANHHFIQHKSITESYSVGDFESEAIDKISTLFKTKDVVIMAGGSGLYVNAITDGLNSFPTIDTGIREGLNAELTKHGIKFLQDKLERIDPVYFNKVDIHNPQRVIRALEVSIGSGKPYSSFIDQPKAERSFKILTVGLKADRAFIYDRINKRVDVMMKAGLLEEAKNVLPFRNYNALQTVGYKELFNYFDEEWTLEFAISEIKKNTRRFAKRQLTWFLRNKHTIWFDYEYEQNHILNEINSEILKLKNG